MPRGVGELAKFNVGTRHLVRSEQPCAAEFVRPGQGFLDISDADVNDDARRGVADAFADAAAETSA